MALDITSTALPEVMLVETDSFPDPRGLFMELFHCTKYAAQGVDRVFVQDNFSRSCGRTLRGLHYQLRHPQAKLVCALRGSIYDVAADIRTGSPTFGQWVGQELSEENHRQMYIPEGFAHGFCVLSETADVLYKCTAFYTPDDDRGIRWNDNGIGIAWPLDDPRLSPKDAALPRLRDVPAAELPRYRPA